MAFKGKISLPGASSRKIGHSDFNSQNIADAFGAGMTVTGVSETAKAFQALLAKSLLITTFTSKRTAQAVLKKSLRHTPVDTSDLFDSGFWASTDSISGEQLNPTVIEENIEATVAAYAAKLGGVGGEFVGASGFFGARKFVKYTVGYRDWKAAAVHENPNAMEFHQDADAKRHFPDRKTDHFLLNAYHAYKHRYSRAMLTGIQTVANAIAAHHAKSLPRLIKKTR